MHTYHCTLVVQLARGVARVDKAQIRTIECFNRYLNILLEYFDISIFNGRAQPTCGWAWALPGPPMANSMLSLTTGVVYLTDIKLVT